MVQVNGNTQAAAEKQNNVAPESPKQQHAAITLTSSTSTSKSSTSSSSPSTMPRRTFVDAAAVPASQSPRTAQQHPLVNEFDDHSSSASYTGSEEEDEETRLRVSACPIFNFFLIFFFSLQIIFIF
jgi:hypothetical protein